METGWPNCPRYFRNNYENLKTKFTGAENIENNWSQSMQDMFVLSKRSSTTKKKVLRSRKYKRKLFTVNARHICIDHA